VSASARGHVDVVRTLLAAGADTEVTVSALGGRTPLMWALGNGNAAMAQVPLEGGATVDARQPGWRTPLMMAAAGGHVEVVRMLLAAGADVAAKDSDGRTALDLALAASRAGAVALLQDAGKSRPAR